MCELPERQADAAEVRDMCALISVPRFPNKEMIEAAYWASIDDDIAGVWEARVTCWLQQRELG
jgi:hypothetical protein